MTTVGFAAEAPSQWIVGGSSLYARFAAFASTLRTATTELTHQRAEVCKLDWLDHNDPGALVAISRSIWVDQSSPSAQSAWEQSGFAPWVEPAYQWLRPALPLLGIYAIVRIGLLIADALAGHISYGTHPDGPLTAWDGHWYLSVAAHGYPAVAPVAGGHLTYSAAGFEPVFPAFIRAAEAIGFTAVQAALVVSMIAGAVSVVLVWRLGTALFDERVGGVAAILFALFPGMAISWGMTYCECVGLALVAGCLLLMVQQRWFWAGVTGALATATSKGSDRAASEHAADERFDWHSDWLSASSITGSRVYSGLRFERQRTCA